nr:MAG TPA: hypothetical protein [Caudoviricetes sp.]
MVVSYLFIGTYLYCSFLFLNIFYHLFLFYVLFS